MQNKKPEIARRVIGDVLILLTLLPLFFAARHRRARLEAERS